MSDVERIYAHLSSRLRSMKIPFPSASGFVRSQRALSDRNRRPQAIAAAGLIPRDLLKKFSADLVEVLRQPQANKETTILVIGIILVLLLLTGLFLWLIASVLFRKNRATIELYEAKHYEVSGGKVAWLGPVVFSVLLITSVAGIYHYGTRSYTCAQCHQREYERSGKSSPHRTVECTGCHRSPGPSGHIAQSLDYARWLVAYASNKGVPGDLEALVSNDACISCHPEVLRKTTVRWAVRVRHADFLAAGARCLECHGDAFHGSAEIRRKGPTMDKCVVCHDGARISAECSLCHTDKRSFVSREMPSEIMRIDVEPMRNCRGCHAQDSKSACVKCHGLEMPHPQEWVRRPGEGGPNAHARAGFLEKVTCKKCHRFDEGLPAPIHPTDPINLREIFCNRCHEYSSPHGSVERWLKRHGPEALKRMDSDNPLCGSCHSANNERLCSKCHSPDLCSYCHANGVREIEEGNAQRR